MAEASRVTVNGFATTIYANASQYVVHLVITNKGAAAIDIGGSEMQIFDTSGYQLAANGTVTVTLQAGDELYGISASADQIVHVLQT